MLRESPVSLMSRGNDKLVARAFRQLDPQPRTRPKAVQRVGAGLTATNFLTDRPSECNSKPHGHLDSARVDEFEDWLE